MHKILALIPFLALAGAHAAPVRYGLDPEHSFPSFEVDHMGLSVWRGRFNKTSGSVLLDAAAQRGSVDIAIDTASVDFGLEAMNEKVRAAAILDVEKFPTATYRGSFANFAGGMPRELRGELTLHGVTKPVRLQIVSFKCIKEHPVHKRETCGADARGSFNRGDFGIGFGLDMGFKPVVHLRIQVEALQGADAGPGATESVTQ
ncbi:YceI family protein [Xylophilus sp. GW821-FHT01B05]